MLGINGGEFIVLAILAVLILGPEKLPEYAQQLGRLVRELRRMATGAKEQLREEVGDEIADLDWRKLDPRQYDPRKIIRDALLDDFDDAINAAKEPLADSSSRDQSQRALTAGNTIKDDDAAPVPQLAAGERAPFDTEAT
ncbi:sec-independent translocase [Neomicrococcus aestuarii]|uniref:Sec-independent protein translocase TatB n=1 Tax=Neomicrococcus aestuarii TaxID=556325 RepID=A0A1L2ZRG3_9MICC|nr:sec-independent translocase [Neomicrococcus aestuarii]APF41591.1 Sec-independent protein translocase TatB [Neomicrococcus aestuarii]